VFFVGIPAGVSTRLVRRPDLPRRRRLLGLLHDAGRAVCSRAAGVRGHDLGHHRRGAALALLAIPRLGEVTWSALGCRLLVNAGYLAVLPTALAYVLYYAWCARPADDGRLGDVPRAGVRGVACSWLLAR